MTSVTSCVYKECAKKSICYKIVHCKLFNMKLIICIYTYELLYVVAVLQNMYLRMSAARVSHLCQIFRNFVAWKCIVILNENQVNNIPNYLYYITTPSFLCYFPYEKFRGVLFWPKSKPLISTKTIALTYIIICYK